MPIWISTLVDRVGTAKRPPVAAPLDGTSIRLPRSIWVCLGRGALGRCPRCARAKLFRRFLKPAAACPYCSQDWTYQRADDLPAYLAIIISGHLVAPLIITLVSQDALSTMAIAITIVSVTIVLATGLLQPSKGAVIGLQWWLGLHGFKKERLGASEMEAD